MIIKRFFLIGAAMLVSAGMAQAVTPLWMRDVRISPDGSQIAFTYKGDIYKVDAKGGKAERLTTLASYESRPVWSPDGKQIAFASDRNGGQDVFIMPATGGSATQLTFNSANEIPEAFTPDGKSVLFSAVIQDPAESALFPYRALTEVYSVPAKGGRTRQVLGTPAVYMSFMPDGRSFVYEDVKGSEDKFRKHHTSSVTRDIWLYDASTGKHTNLTHRGGEDRNPVVSADGSTVYFLSERDGGSFNLYSFNVNDPAKLTRLTDFSTHPLRFLSRGSDGTFAFTYDGEIYTMREGHKPAKVAIDVTVDEENKPEQLRVGVGRSAAVSPDGKQVAFTSRGEVFVTATDYPSTKQVTNTTEAESDPAWGSDSRTLYYTSERDGHYNIYKATIGREDDPNFSNATIINEEPVFSVKDKVDRTHPSISPDGTKMAFVEDRTKLKVMDLKTKKVRQLTDGSTVASRSKGFASQWSPDGEWLLIEATDLHHQPYSDIAIINVADGKMTYVTKTGYFDQNPRWAMGGKAIIFESERYGMRNHASWGSESDVMIAFLNRDAFDRFRLSEEDYELLKEVEKAQKSKKNDAASGKDSKKADDAKKKADSKKADGDKEKVAEKVAVDLEGIADRTIRLTPNSSALADMYLTPDGETLYYITSFEKGYDLWKAKPRKGDVSKVTKLGAGAGIDTDKAGNMYLLGSTLRKFDTKSEKLTPITFSASMTIDQAAEREYMLRYVYNEERERFFRTDMNGADWDNLYKAYKRFLPHIDNNYDFADLLSELLGELNVSHTGGRYYPSGAAHPTAQLGLLYDLGYDGAGLKVAEVIKGGPFDRSTSRVKAGDIVKSINGQALTADTDPSVLLADLTRKKTLVGFHGADGTDFEEVILPISQSAQNALMYDRWVRQREADVERWSNGRLGYVHIQSMDDGSFRKLYAKALGEYIDKEGIVIDTRFNGGGRLHEDIEVMFSGKKYLTQDVHGVETTDMPSRRWNKPSVMVIGEANYSNAHGTPWVYRHLGLGKLVGMPVPGTMSSVNWVTLQDPSLVFGIPVTGFRTSEGYYLENTQLEPDVKVANDPATVVKEEDTQLRAAVESLLNDLKSKK
ncbi:S41 family peptidase [Paramuribaculum intestinale]|uniref:S41 family peptidase n=1 Tax=Paramuribaculum intestinale TaxID=2094151 RepID=UPI002674769B|nr:S41 family peptidase [Paramuribaculum intestinale]